MTSPIVPINKPDDDDSVFFDLLKAPFRGVEGAVQGVYNLADYATFDALPDYDEKFLGKSTTVPGSLVEGASQFLTGFVPIFGLAGRVGTAAKAGSLTQKALSGTVSRGVVAGAITDFTMFNGQEERLSNFIQQFPELQNPVTEFLSHDDDEGEIEGRLKNVLEGLGLEAATFGLIKGLKALKRGKSARANGDAPEDVYKGMSEELGEDQVALLPDFLGQATPLQEKTVFNSLRQLANDPTLFRGQASQKETLEESIADVFPQLKIEGDLYIPTLEQGSIKITDPNDLSTATKISSFKIKTDKAGDVNVQSNVDANIREILSNGVIDSSSFKNRDKYIHVDTSETSGKRGVNRGKDTGSKMYQTILQHTFNGNHLYVPSSLVSTVNQNRLIGAMLSSALKNNSTAHFIPERNFIEWKGLPDDYVWGRDFEKDIEYLAEFEALIVKDVFKLNKFSYDFSSDKIIKKGEEFPRTDDVELSDEDLLREITDVDPTFKNGIGVRTLKRAILNQELRKGETPFKVLSDKYKDTKLLGGDKDLVVKIATENKNDAVHLSNKETVDFTVTKQVKDSTDPSVNKPEGLYYASGDKWLSHIQEKAPAMSRRGTNAHKLDLNQEVIFKLDSTNIKEFEDKYLVKTDFVEGDRVKDNWIEDEQGNFVNKFTTIKQGDSGYADAKEALTQQIDWDKMSKDWSGIEVDLESFGNNAPSWTKGWDISQGVIWDKKALKNTSKLTKETPSTAVEGTRLERIFALEDFVEARPPRQPHKTNLEAKRGLEGSRGPDYIKKRLQAKFTVKGADPEDVKDIETFIDTIGERMFDDVSMSITSKIQARGRFNFANKLLEIRKSAIEEGDLKRPMIHELWHSLSRYLPKKDVTALTKQFEKARADYLKGLGDGPITADPSTVTTSIRSKELTNFKKGVYNEDNYRFSDVDEYFAEEMTDAFLSKLDADDALAAPGTFKRVAQEMAILLKDLFASLKSKLGIDQRQKIFNDFIKQRNVKIQRQAPLDFSSGKVAEMKDFGKEVSPEHAGIARAIAKGEEVTLPRFETADQLHSLTAALRAEVMRDPQTMSKLVAEAEKELPVDFGDNAMTDRFKHMEQTVENQRQVRLEATVYKKIGTGMVNKLHKIAQEYKASGGGDVATANLKNAFQEIVQFSEMYWKLGRETSLALGVRRQGGGRRRKLGLDSNEMTGEGIRKNFVNENGGMSPDKIIKAVEEGIDPNDLESSINGMFKLARKTQGHKLLDVATEYWINSILSGPRTQMVNIMGNGLTTVWSTLEAAVGGVLSGNLEVTKQAFASWADMSMFREAMKFAKNAAKSGENLLDPDARAFNEGRRDAIVPEAFGMKEGQRGYGTVSKIGDYLRLPSRLLLTTDEFFKQLNYRRAARFKLAMDGVTKQGIKDPRQLALYVEKGLEDVITSGGRHYSEESLIREGALMADKNGIKDSTEKAEFVSKYVQDNSKGKDVSALADFALEESRYLTFTKDLDQGSLGATIQRATQSWSPLRFVMPFVRTPTNILAFAFERTPGVLMPGFLKAERKQLLEGIRSSDPIERSRTMGKLATSTALTAVLIDTIVNNREYITGGGPKDEKQKKALRATGWQPYSFKIDGKYYSYQRLDPLGTILGVGADLVETGIKAPKDVNTSTYENLFSALSITFARNVTNKSYLAGVQMFTEALSDPERYSDRLLRNLGSSMLPYSGFLNQIQYGTGDQEAREVRSLADALLNKLPGGRDNLDPKRNLLGEEVIIENTPIIGAINPIATSTQKNDAVLNEMANLNHAFREPPSTYNGLIDLLGYTNAKGQTAHDRRNEKLQSVKIGGRTLRQALERLIKSRNYQRLSDRSEPGLPSPRIQQITSLLTKYRSEALDETMQEFPELGDYYEQVTRAKRSFKAGADHSSVLSLLNQ